MAADNKDSSPPPVGGIAVLVLLAAGIFVKHQYPFETSRPSEANLKAQQSWDAIQNVDARLWEDPFAAVARWQQGGGTTSGASNPELEIHVVLDQQGANRRVLAVTAKDKSAPAKYRSWILNQDVPIVGAMVYGGPYADDVEGRRRVRYAVLAGLDASGYVPYSNDKIGFFEVQEGPTATVLPFEFFEKDGGKGQLLLLWIPEEKLGVRPYNQLMWLLDKVSHRGQFADLTLIGPSNSFTLKNLIAELNPKCGNARYERIGEQRGTMRRATFYSYGSTATPNDLLPVRCRSSSETAGDRFSEPLLEDLFDESVQVVRTISNDGEVIEALVEELALRGVVPGLLRPGTPDRVVLISEWDTDYGRNLPDRFIDSVCGHVGDSNCRGPDNRDPPWVTRVSYMRGLDGGVASSSDKRSDKESTNKEEKSKGSPQAGGPSERADGSSQYDYLRRLAFTVEQRTHEGREKKRVTAVGVLGTDPYDKLLVLQALRPQFPDAVFFTTDLDARLLQAGQHEWTRNLLIGSGHGLELNSAVQGRAPPFRDAYQTAAFLAVRVALDRSIGSLDDKRVSLNEWLMAPYVYEIGRTGAFALQPHPEDQKRSPCLRLGDCGDIRPPLPFFGPTDPYVLSEASLWVFSIAVLLRLLTKCGWPFGRRAWGSARERRAARAVVVCVPLLLGMFAYRFFLGPSVPSTLLNTLIGFLAPVAAIWLLRAYVLWFRAGTDLIWQWVCARRWAWIAIALAILLLGAFVSMVGSDPQGEPFAWIEGISLWPTELIRAFAAILSIFFIVRALRPVELQPGKPNGFLPAEADLERNAMDPRLFSWHEAYRRRHDTVDAHRLWGEFRALERGRARLGRMWRPFGLYFFLISCIAYVLGPPVVPFRGDLAKHVDSAVVLIAAMAFLVLLFVVIDAIRLGTTMIGNLSTGQSIYPASTMKDFRVDLNYDAKNPDKPLYELLDIRLIGAYSEQLSTLTYYPFVILALMVVARSSIFDSWRTPPSLFIVFLIPFLVTFACALLLQRSAQRARDMAVERMTAYLLHARGDSPQKTSYIAQLQMMLDEIKGERRGAFLPVLQQPIVKAFMVPAGSLGGLQLIEYALTGTGF